MLMLLRTLLQPYPLLVLLLGAGLAWAWRRSPQARRAWLLPGAAWLLLFLLSQPLASYLALGSLEWRYPPLQSRPDDLDAIVVLGSYIYPANRVRPRPELDEVGLARTHAAAELYRQGRRVPVVVSGGKPNPADPGPACADAMAEVLRQEGVPAEDIVIENASTDTAENAARSAALLRERGCKRVAVVTDAWHLPRAVACFRKQGLDVVAAGCGYHATGFELTVANVLPNLGALQTSQLALNEWRNLAWYRLRGWV